MVGWWLSGLRRLKLSALASWTAAISTAPSVSSWFVSPKRYFSSYRWLLARPSPKFHRESPIAVSFKPLCWTCWRLYLKRYSWPFASFDPCWRGLFRLLAFPKSSVTADLCWRFSLLRMGTLVDTCCSVSFCEFGVLGSGKIYLVDRSSHTDFYYSLLIVVRHLLSIDACFC